MDAEALEAAKTGNLPKLADRLEAGVDINARDVVSHQTLLHHAASNGQREVVRWLLCHGADALLADLDERTVLHAAMGRFDDATVNAILENVSRGELRKLLDAKTKSTGSSALHLAVEADCSVDASYLLEHGANFEMRDAAGEKPVDLASDEELRDSLRQIEACFVKAKRGEPQLERDLKELDALSDVHVAQALNCRDRFGRTIIQLLVAEGHTKLALDVLRWRVQHPINREVTALHDPKRQDEVDRLAELTRECRDSHLAREREVEVMSHAKTTKRDFHIRVVKMMCRSLEQVRGMLLAFREFQGERKSGTPNSKLRTLEQVFEALGFDPEGREDGADICFQHGKLPAKWNFASFAKLMDTIHDGVENLLTWIDRERIFRAVKDGDADRVQRLVKSGASVEVIDQSGHTVLCHAVESGDRKMVKILLKSGARLTYESVVSSSGRDIANNWKRSLYKAVDGGHAKVVKLLLRKTSVEEVAELLDYRHGNEDTMLHAAARTGQLGTMKILLRYGASYEALDTEGRKPKDVAESEEVREVLKLVEECFEEAKKANVEVVCKLKGMQTDEFMAVAGTKNNEGQTLVAVAAKAKAKSIAEVVLRRIKEEKQNEK